MREQRASRADGPAKGRNTGFDLGKVMGAFRQDRFMALKVAAAYAGAAALYIVASDYLASTLFGGDKEILVAQLLKGMMFVLVTAALLYWLTRRFLRWFSQQQFIYERVLRSITDAVFVVRRRDRRIMYANKAVTDILGYEADQLVGRITEVLYPSEEDYGRAREIMRNELDRTGEAHFRFRLRRRDGTVFPTEHRVTSFQTRSDGEYVVSRVRDISKEMETERQRRLYEQRLRTIIEAVPVPLAMVRAADDQVVFMNRPLKHTLGLEDADLTDGLRSQDFYVEKDNFETLRSRLLADGYLDPTEVQVKRKDEAELWVAGTARIVEYEGEQMILLAFLDITSMRQNRELLARAQKMEAVGQLTGGVAHDFNNLLTVILLNCEAIIDGTDDQFLIDACAKDIHAAGNKAAELVHKLLTFSRQGTGEPEQVDLNEVVQDQYSLLRRTVGSDIEIAALLNDKPVNCRVDRGALENVIINLAVNARDAMRGGGTLTIRTDHHVVGEAERGAFSELRPGYYVSISVSDTGSGMPHDVADRAFEPFFTTKDVGQGTGLGLSTVYGFATAAGGIATIDTGPGEGTTVSVYLPREFANTATRTGIRPYATLPKGRENILLVEDESQIREFGRRQLESLGYSVTAVGDSDNALAVLANSDARFDLLFSDIVMPGSVNGYELAARARDLSPGIGVLLTTGYAQRASDPQGEGVHDYVFLQKPYLKGDLARRVRETLDAKVAV